MEKAFWGYLNSKLLETLFDAMEEVFSATGESILKIPMEAFWGFWDNIVKLSLG